MARGWESKAVEEQMNEREAGAFRGESDAVKASSAERARQTQIRSLQLSRSRISNQLASATNPAHRTMLERALAALDQQIAEASKDEQP